MQIAGDVLGEGELPRPMLVGLVRDDSGRCFSCRGMSPLLQSHRFEQVDCRVTLTAPMVSRP